jgi:hypothetical protein
MEWQPIETAPKNTDVLLWDKRCKQLFVGCKINGTFRADKSFVMAFGSDRAYVDDDVTDSDITHWMPLPPPPEPK